MMSQNEIAISVQGLSSVSSIKELTLEPNIAKWQQKNPVAFLTFMG